LHLGQKEGNLVLQKKGGIGGGEKKLEPLLWDTSRAMAVPGKGNATWDKTKKKRSQKVFKISEPCKRELALVGG